MLYELPSGNFVNPTVVETVVYCKAYDHYKASVVLQCRSNVHTYAGYYDTDDEAKLDCIRIGREINELCRSNHQGIEGHERIIELSDAVSR